MKRLLTLGAVACACAVYAQTTEPETAAAPEAAAAPETAAAPASSSPENYMRSSIYTFLLKSHQQNLKLDEEAKTEGAGAANLRVFSSSNARTNDSISVSEAPQLAFVKIAIPDQFNDHNLGTRVVLFDEIANTLTDDDKKAGEADLPKKKSGFGSFLVGLGKEAIGMKTNTTNDYFDENVAAVTRKYLNTNHIADSIVARWFDYGKTPEVWDLDLVIERGMANASAEDKELARAQGLSSGLGQREGLELLKNTFVIGVNLRFRSNQAIVAEAESVTTGLLGADATSLLGTVASAAAGEGFQVQAHTYLYQLVWNEEKLNEFQEKIFANKASLDDLIASGICQLVFVGKEKAGARVRQSLFNKTPQSTLIARATERAIDAAIAKLQEKYDVFRTAFPISAVDGQGNVMAKVGMKEGISKNDEYEILEQTIDKKGNLVWKSVGKVKAVDKLIWDNRVGAAEDFAEDLAEAQEKGKKVSEESNYANLGFTTFKGAKKNQDYTGYFLRLKKKK